MGSKEKEEPVEITTGMSSIEVLLALGKPLKVEHVEMEDAILEVWTYNIPRGSRIEMRQTGSRDMPYVDPITGEPRMISEPELTPETTQITERTKIYFDNERVVTWESNFEESRELME